MPVVLITGASRGLGLEFARQYAADGWSVIAACRDPNAPALKALASGQLRVVTLDVGDKSSIAALPGQLDNMALDLLINNAGIYSGQPRQAGEHDASQTFGTLDAEAWTKVLRINTIAPLLVTQALLPRLKQGRNAKAIFISSKMGSIGMLNADGDLAYRTSKAALNAAYHNLALTLAPDKITVAGFHPGWVRTEMGGPQADLAPEESVRGMRAAIAELTQAQSGQLLNYDGSVIPW